MRRLAPLFSLFFLLLISSPITAQTSPTIEQGVVNFTSYSGNPSATFSLVGPELTMLTGRLVDGNQNPTGPHVGGEEIQISSLFSGSASIRPGDLITGSGTRFVYYSGTLTVDSLPVTLPTRFGRTPWRIVVPITLLGDLEVHATDPFSNPDLLFQIPLRLQGEATLTLRTIYIDFMGRPVYQFTGLTYDLTGPITSANDER